MSEVQSFGAAIDYLKGKLPEATLAWDDLAGPVHGKVFAVAGATSADLLADLQAALVSAKESGTTITQFRKDFDAAVQKAGWTYKGKRGWRTGVVFNANMRSASMAGRWAQLQANKHRRPFLQYRTAGDARVRPEHRQWNGLVFHIDHPFWLTHFPPNGWGCRCTVRAYSQEELDALGLTVETDFVVKTREVITRDGEIKDRVPVGIDPGWDHNVGQSWIDPEIALGQKLARLPLPLRGIWADRTISPAFQTVLNGNFAAFQKSIKQPTGRQQVVGFLDSATLNGLAREVPQLDLQSTAVVVEDSKTAHLAGRHKQGKPQVWPDDWRDKLPARFRDYRAVLWDVEHDSLVVVPSGTWARTLVPRIVIRLNYKTKAGPVSSVVSLGAGPMNQLRDTAKFKLLVGNLK